MLYSLAQLELSYCELDGDAILTQCKSLELLALAGNNMVNSVHVVLLFYLFSYFLILSLSLSLPLTLSLFYLSFQKCVSPPRSLVQLDLAYASLSSLSPLPRLERLRLTGVKVKWAKHYGFYEHKLPKCFSSSSPWPSSLLLFIFFNLAVFLSLSPLIICLLSVD